MTDVPARPAQGGSAAEAGPATDSADLRLVIEQDQASGGYVYKTVNRLTGEVVLSLPRDDVLRLREDSHYAAGSVVRTKV